MAVWLCSTSDGGDLLVGSEAESPDRVLCPANPRPYVNTKLFSRVLKDFAQHFRAGKNKRIILTLDQAGWHLSHQLEVPEGIHLVPLPPYSPELQPAERLWPLVDEPLANQAFETIAEVEELVVQRCRRLLQQQQLIQGLTFYHWWPEVEAAA